MSISFFSTRFLNIFLFFFYKKKETSRRQSVAQLGSAPVLGTGCRGFKSCHSEKKLSGVSYDQDRGCLQRWAISRTLFSVRWTTVAFWYSLCFFSFWCFLDTKEENEIHQKVCICKAKQKAIFATHQTNSCITFCCVFYSVKKQDKISSTAQFSKFSKMGCSQVVRRRNLGPSIKGSNPFIPVFCASSLRSLSKPKNFYYAKNRGHTAFTKLCCAGYFVLFFTE